MTAPLEAYIHLLKDCEPSTAAEVLAKNMGWRWPTVAYNPDAPLLLREIADQKAWERFSPPNPITQKQVAAHCLFRAASYQTGAARARLIHLAQELVGEVVNTWLQDRPDISPQR